MLIVRETSLEAKIIRKKKIGLRRRARRKYYSIKSIKDNPLLYILLYLLILIFPRPVLAQLVVTSPSAADRLKASAGYAEEVLRDSWDMNERTDLGWRIFNTVELPLSYLTNISFSNGLFTAQTVYTPGTGDPNYSDAKITILESAYPGSAMLGKVGTNFPINADKYTVLVFRMYLGPSAAGPYGQLLWSKNTIYNGVATSGSFLVDNGWRIYVIDIPSLGIAAGTDPWNGMIDSLRLDPTIIKDQTVKIDWIRLVERDPSAQRTITWTGATGGVDIYLDDDNDPANGNLGILAKNVSGGSYTFLAGGLMAGKYYVAIAPTGTTQFSYSSGYYQVNDTPVVNFTKPGPGGSDEDYITVTFHDPWDMANAEDVEHTENIQNEQFTTINAEDLKGNNYTSLSVYYGESLDSGGGIADPNVFFLHFLWRGGIVPIDTTKYHYLTFRMSVWGEQNVSEGSIARVMWKRNDESVENVSQDIIIRHLPNKWVMNEIVCDLNDLPLEEGLGSPSHSGWTGLVDCFRIDPHEFPESRAFVFDEVRITSDWRADESFSIEWEVSDSDDTPTVSLYYDTDKSGYDGVLIVANKNSLGSDSWLWDTSSLPAGTYWLYAEVSDGLNTTRCYAPTPVIVQHTSSVPVISLSKSKVVFGGEVGGAVTSDEKVYVTNAGEGSLSWQATATKNWIIVNPSSGSGNGEFQVGVDISGLSPGIYTGQVVVSDPQASNSPQVVEVELTVYSLSGESPPFGVFDTPVEGATVSGNIPVTGWALDDVEVERVEIKRAPHSSDPPEVIGPDGLVYIGDAVFVKGARPDVEAAYPEYPKADLAGWGYMMLTNFLPNQGNGQFTIYAIAYDGSGHRVELGHKVINCDNANRVLPFGTIDTPGQGETISSADYINFGWALTPQPKYIPTDGSTIWVWVDGVPLGHPVYNNYRADIATLFPGYANSDGAVGYYYLDTTSFENGVHNIAWSIEDNEGATDGIGSRYFEIMNVSGGAVKEHWKFNKFDLGQDILRSEENELNEKKNLFRDQIEKIPSSYSSVFFRRGYSLTAEPVEIFPDVTGTIRIKVRELERMEINISGDKINLFNLFNEQGKINKGEGKNKNWFRMEDTEEVAIFAGSGYYTGYLVVGKKLKSLPIGSVFESEKGIFIWQPGPGFIGDYNFVFIYHDNNEPVKKVKIHIKIKPKFQ